MLHIAMDMTQTTLYTRERVCFFLTTMVLQIIDLLEPETLEFIRHLETKYSITILYCKLAQYLVNVFVVEFENNFWIINNFNTKLILNLISNEA